MTPRPAPYSRPVVVGATTIHWLPAAMAIPEVELAAGLHADEQADAGTMRHQARREEYRRSRYLVRQLTGITGPLARGAAGEPQWPAGIIGSITHKQGNVGVALEADTALYGLGIDAELTTIRPELASKIVAPDEARLLAAQPDQGAALAAAFSFKEAIFKACFPRGRIMFYFHDAAIDRLDLATGQLEAILRRDVGPSTPRGTRLHGNVCLLEETTPSGAAARFAVCAVRIASPVG